MRHPGFDRRGIVVGVRAGFEPSATGSEPKCAGFAV